MEYTKTFTYMHLVVQRDRFIHKIRHPFRGYFLNVRIVCHKLAILRMKLWIASLCLAIQTFILRIASLWHTQKMMCEGALKGNDTTTTYFASCNCICKVVGIDNMIFTNKLCGFLKMAHVFIHFTSIKS